MRACSIDDCAREAVVYPVILAWAKGCKVPEMAPATGIMRFSLCSFHAAGLKLSDFVTDELWGNIVAAMRMNDKEPPDRETLEIAFTPIATGDEEYARDGYPRPENVN